MGRLIPVFRYSIFILVTVFLSNLPSVRGEEMQTPKLLESISTLQENVKAGCEGRGRNEAREALNRENISTLKSNSDWVAQRVKILTQKIAHPTEELDADWDKEMNEKIQLQHESLMRDRSSLRDLMRMKDYKDSQKHFSRIEKLKSQIIEKESQIERWKDEQKQNRPSANPELSKKIITQSSAELRDLSRLSDQYQRMTRDAGFCLWDSQGRPGLTPEDADKQEEEQRKIREKGNPTQNFQLSPSFSPLENPSPIQIMPSTGSTPVSVQ